MLKEFELRLMAQDELNAVNALAVKEDMPPLDSADGVTLAVSPEGQIVGYIHVLPGADGAMHVQSLASDSDWRGIGVGRALIEQAYDQHHDLRLVARGSAVGFYQKLGYHEVPWEDIDFNVSDDCYSCEIRDMCHPLPMRKERA